MVRFQMKTFVVVLNERLINYSTQYGCIDDISNKNIRSFHILQHLKLVYLLRLSRMSCFVRFGVGLRRAQDKVLR